MNKLIAERDPIKLLELKKSISNLTYQIYQLPEPNRSLLIDHIRTHSKKTNQLHIFTDIDDTIYSSRIGGSDITFKNHTVYPGVYSFYKYVSTSGFVTLVTARPYGIYSNFKNKISKIIGKPVDVLYGLVRDLNTGIGIDIMKRLFLPLISSSVFYPSKIEHVTGVIPNQWYTNYSNMGKTKFISIVKYVKIYPEFNFIFIGDSGQGDLICAHDLYEHKRAFPQFPIQASFIHNIIRSNGSKPERMIQDDHLIKDLEKRGIYLFHNYIDLAGQLYSLNLISHRVLEHIINDTINDFNKNKKENVYIKDPVFIHFIEDDLHTSASKYKTI